MTELEDLKNRLEQFIEINQHIVKVDSDVETVHGGVSTKTLALIQIQAYQTVLELIKQLKKTGKIYRGNDYVPDSIEVTLKQIRGSLL